MLAFWLFDQIGLFLSQKPTAGPWAFRVAQMSFGVITLIAIAVHLQTSTFAAEVDQNSRLMLQTNTQQVLATAPAGSVIFAQDNPLLHHLQFERDYTLYTGETFNKGFIDQLPQIDPDEPQGWEPGRRDAPYKRLKDLSQAQLDEDQRRLMTMALDSGRRVFFVIPRRDNDPPPQRARRLNQADVREFRRMFPGGEMIRRFATPDRFELNLVAAWQTPIVRPSAAGRDEGAPTPRRSANGSKTDVLADRGSDEKALRAAASASTQAGAGEETADDQTVSEKRCSRSSRPVPRRRQTPRDESVYLNPRRRCRL